MKIRLLLLIFVVSNLAACRPVADGGRVLLRSLSGVTLNEITVDGASMAYMERPADGPTLVLLHGFASEKDSWLRFLRKIPK
ncbi:MAG: hypothetical protein HKM98_01965, partial [Gammaproteobacteria bacterium]|nr:hypothetical protein [Gammaproteobacteria bacterium]